MSASGPFAMGPTQAGRSISHSALASADSVDPSRLNVGLLQAGPPSLGKYSKRGKEKQVKAEDEEVYSDPDEGVEIVDMDQVQKIDWMAPDVLRKERRTNDTKIKQENLDDTSKSLRFLICWPYD
jgi:DNA-directed RNA polymerase III subunit RPC4